MKYQVEVCRTSYGNRMIFVEAESADLAEDMAMDVAGNFAFDEHASEYQVVSISGEGPGATVTQDTRSDDRLTGQELANRYIGPDGSWGQHPTHTLEDWKSEIEEENTRQGYWDWVAYMLAGASEHGG